MEHGRLWVHTVRVDRATPAASVDLDGRQRWLTCSLRGFGAPGVLCRAVNLDAVANGDDEDETDFIGNRACRSPSLENVTFNTSRDISSLSSHAAMQLLHWPASLFP